MTTFMRSIRQSIQKLYACDAFSSSRIVRIGGGGCGSRGCGIQQQQHQQQQPRRWNSSSSSSSSSAFYDVAIVGGGAVGAALACNLKTKLPLLKVALIESRIIPTYDFDGNTTTTTTTAGDGTKSSSHPPPHPRSYALSPKSLSILGPAVQSKLQPVLGYYDSMQVWQANSPATLTFTSKDIADDPSATPELYLGACCEDLPLVSALWEELADGRDASSSSSDGCDGGVDCYTNVSKIQSVGTGDVGSLATLTTNDGKKFEAAVLVGADGGNSFIRKETGISRVGLEYEQHAQTFTVELDGSMGMGRRAFQRYLSDGGPMALLPTYSPNHAVIVWSTNPETISKWKNASEDEFVAHLNECIREGPQRVPPLFEALSSGNNNTTQSSSILSNLAYGADRVLDTMHYGLAMASHHPDPTFRVPPMISKIVSQQYTFPLSCFQATTYVKGRVALVGDAAHSVHPMAGQGLNLGLGDVESLVGCLEKAATAGMDLSSFLQEYNNQRQRSVSLSLGGIHALQRLFRDQNAPLQHTKTFGMNLIQNFPPMRRRLALAAAHGVSL